MAAWAGPRLLRSAGAAAGPWLGCWPSPEGARTDPGRGLGAAVLKSVQQRISAANVLLSAAFGVGEGPS